MAENSSTPVAAPQSPPEISSTPENDAIRRTKPGKKRLLLTLIVLFSFILGFPFLLKSTEIYRSPLPYTEIESLSGRVASNALYFPYRFQVVLIGFGNEFDGSRVRAVEKSVYDQIRRSAGGAGEFSVFVTSDSGGSCTRSRDWEHSCKWRCGSVDLASFDKNVGGDDAIDEVFRVALRCSDSAEKVYSAMVVNKEEDVRFVVGKYRHFWISGRVTEEGAIDTISNVFVEVFMNGGLLKGKGEFMPVGADGNLILSFNLLNSDPGDWLYDWDFRRIEDTLLAPVVEALAPIANIGIESQVLYHTPKSAFSNWNEDLAANVFRTKDLPFFVNSNEWHLDTSTAATGRSRLLQFVLYIPSAKECPLLLQLPDGEISATNAFISPMWGGVKVWNPQSCPRKSQDDLPFRHTLSAEVSEIIYDRNFDYDYFGFKTLERSYLLKVSGKVVERPQHLLMRVAVGIHMDDIDFVIRTYHMMSQRWFTHASTTLFNAGTPRP